MGQDQPPRAEVGQAMSSPETLDRIYNEIDGYVIAGQWELLDSIIRTWDVTREKSVTVGLLTLTLGCQRYLPSRAALYESCIPLLGHRMLDGLR